MCPPGGSWVSWSHIMESKPWCVQSLRSILQKLDISRRIAKWTMELMEFDIHYCPWPSIKAQALVNFLVECTFLEEVEVEADVAAPILEGDVWKRHVDGVSNIGGFGAGMILANLGDTVAEQALHFSFKTSNN